MSQLTVSSEGKLQLGEDDIAHLGVRAGEILEVDQLPSGQLRLRAMEQQTCGDSRDNKGSMDRFFSSLGKPTKVATLEEIQKACEDGWAGLVDMG